MPSTKSALLPTLYIWPKVGEAPSLDPSSLAAYLYLQLHLRGRYVLAYCGSPDDSPSGQLPSLSHGQHAVSGFSAIVKFVDQLESTSHPKWSLNAIERAQAVARIAQIEAELGDLAAYVYFALSANWYAQTRPALTSTLPVPQRYYVPARLRKSHQPRLEMAGLWHTQEQAEGDRFSAFEKLARKKESREKKEKLKHAFQMEKTLSKARGVFTTFSIMLNGKTFFYGSERPSPMDIVFAAHILLLSQPMSNASLANLLKETFPTLVFHSESIYALAFPDTESLPQISTFNLAQSLRSLLPQAPFISAAARPRRRADAEEEANFARWRWALYGTAISVTVFYVYAVGIVPAIVKAWTNVDSRKWEENDVGDEEDGEYEDEEHED